MIVVEEIIVLQLSVKTKTRMVSRLVQRTVTIMTLPRVPLVLSELFVMMDALLQPTTVSWRMDVLVVEKQLLRTLRLPLSETESIHHRP